MGHIPIVVFGSSVLIGAAVTFGRIEVLGLLVLFLFSMGGFAYADRRRR